MVDRVAERNEWEGDARDPGPIALERFGFRRWHVTTIDPVNGRVYGVEKFLFRRRAKARAAHHNRFCRGLLVAKVEKI